MSAIGIWTSNAFGARLGLAFRPWLRWANESGDDVLAVVIALRVTPNPGQSPSSAPVPEFCWWFESELNRDINTYQYGMARERERNIYTYNYIYNYN